MAQSPPLDDIPLVKTLLEHPLDQTRKQKDLEQEWHDRATNLTPMNLKTIEPHLAELDAHLTLRSYIVGYTLSKADLWVWGALRSNRVAQAYIKQGLMVNLTRWSNHLEESEPWISEAVMTAQTAKMSVKQQQDKGKDEEASFDIGLQDTEKGVVTRFPPEPSGYLHIGHAKAAILNDYFAHEKYQGTLLLRFDDTNPSKEKQEFQDAIIEDLALMNIKPDKTSHTSDYFKELHEYCVQILKDCNAYADDTEQEKMRAERMDGIASVRRDASAEDNLARFDEMTRGTDEGARWCIRAKISVDNPNKALRDPVIYRCPKKDAPPHHRTGSTWKAYPTYDFACPIIDAHENVTHALRTTEYKDRDEQYQWILKALKLRNVYNWDFSRLNLIRTLLSKRKLTNFVATGFVEGWDDPRMPTIRGIRRRGMTVDALREYIVKQGPSKNVTLQDWATFWATNKKHIDPIACRYTAVTQDNAVPVAVAGARQAPHTEEKDKSPNHAKTPLGTKKVVYSKDILIDQEDAQTLEQDEEFTLMNWGNAIIRNISHSWNPLNSKTVTGIEVELHLQGDVKKTKKKITWLSKDQELIPVELVDFDFLITKDKPEEDDHIDDLLNHDNKKTTEALADCNVADLKENDYIQFDRKGYFRVDRPFMHGQPAVLFQIPTGKTK